MAALYTLKIVRDFAAAHSLRGYEGACQRLHGHNWKVEVEVSAGQLNDIGIAIDFKVIKSYTKSISKKLDHYYLNEISPFDKINPTAENIAQYFFTELKNKLKDEHANVAAVTVWETERASARYTE